MVRYNATEDPLCYPDTQVLINKAGIKDQDQLDQFESLIFQAQAEEPLPSGNFDAQHYCAIHHHFFAAVYDWAGQYRTIRTAKAQNWFCYPEYISQEMTRIFDELAKEKFLKNTTEKDTFAKRLAYYLAELNAVHPFREGNGRTQLTFIMLIALNAGHKVDLQSIVSEDFLSAMIASFSGNHEALTQQLRALI